MLALFSALKFELNIFVAVVGVVLGLLVYFENRHSYTNKFFLYLSTLGSVWLIFAYLSTDPNLDIGLARLSLAVAPFHSFLIFLLASTIPGGKIQLKNKHLFSLIVFTILLSLLAISKYTFESVSLIEGKLELVVGFGMIIIGLSTIFFIVFAISLLFKRIRSLSTGVSRRQQILFLSGVILMSGLIVFTIVLPVLFKSNYFFVQFAPLYILLFLIITTIAIFKYQLFNIKILATKALVILLWAIFLIKLIISPEDRLVENSILFAIVFILGFLLLRSMSKVQKEHSEENEYLKELTRKTKFLTIAAHHLRTPLSVISGYTELALEDAFGKTPPKLKEVLQNMSINNDRMIKIVEDFLDTARIDQGEMRYNFDDMSLSKVVQEVIDEIEMLPQAQNVSIDWESELKNSMIYGDVQKIRYVLYTLLHNATMYTEEGNVYLKITEADGGVQCSVKDTGIGFSKEDGKQLFEKFYRTKAVEKSNPNGTALALYISRGFIEGHGGRVWAKSEGEGKGGEFGFWMPKKAKAATVKKGK